MSLRIPTDCTCCHCKSGGSHNTISTADSNYMQRFHIPEGCVLLNARGEPVVTSRKDLVCLQPSTGYSPREAKPGQSQLSLAPFIDLSSDVLIRELNRKTLEETGIFVDSQGKPILQRRKTKDVNHCDEKDKLEVDSILTRTEMMATTITTQDDDALPELLSPWEDEEAKVERASLTEKQQIKLTSTIEKSQCCCGKVKQQKPLAEKRVTNTDKSTITKVTSTEVKEEGTISTLEMEMKAMNSAKPVDDDKKKMPCIPSKVEIVVIPRNFREIVMKKLLIYDNESMQNMILEALKKYKWIEPTREETIAVSESGYCTSFSTWENDINRRFPNPLSFIVNRLERAFRNWKSKEYRYPYDKETRREILQFVQESLENQRSIRYYDVDVSESMGKLFNDFDRMWRAGFSFAPFSLHPLLHP